MNRRNFMQALAAPVAADAVPQEAEAEPVSAIEQEIDDQVTTDVKALLDEFLYDEHCQAGLAELLFIRDVLRDRDSMMLPSDLEIPIATAIDFQIGRGQRGHFVVPENQRLIVRAFVDVLSDLNWPDHRTEAYGCRDELSAFVRKLASKSRSRVKGS